MKTLLVLLLGLVAVAVVVDQGSRIYVERRVEAEFRDDPRLEVATVDFAVDSVPFVGGLVAKGEVSATLHLGGVVQRGVEVDAFDLEVDGLRFGRRSAFQGEVVVTGLDRATTSVTLSAGTIGDLAGVPVDIGADGTVTAGDVTAEATLVDGELVVQGESFGTVGVPVPLERYLPCDPAVEVVDRQVVLTCVTDRLPPVVDRVIGEAGLRG